MKYISRLFSTETNSRLNFSTAATKTLTKYVISGYPECRFFQKAQKVGDLYQSKYPDEVSVTVVSLPYEEYHQYRMKTLGELDMAPDSHKTCPLVYTAEENLDGGAKPLAFTGGCDNFCALMVKNYGPEDIATRPGWK